MRCTSAPRRPGSTSSNTLYMRRATPARSPAARAASRPAVSGRRRMRQPSSLAKSSGVGTEKAGLHSTTWQSGRAGRVVSTSPRPSARAVPPRTQ